jgi:hypothetical protein
VYVQNVEFIDIEFAGDFGCLFDATGFNLDDRAVCGGGVYLVSV